MAQCGKGSIFTVHAILYMRLKRGLQFPAQSNIFQVDSTIFLTLKKLTCILAENLTLIFTCVQQITYGSKQNEREGGRETARETVTAVD